MEPLDHLAGILLSCLAWSSLQAVLLIGAVALIARLLPRLPAATRCMLWWLVGLQLVLGLCWHAPLELPLLAPATASVVSPMNADDSLMPATAVNAEASAAALAPPPGATVPAPDASRSLLPHWRLLLAALWLAGLLPQLVLAIRQWCQLRAVLRHSVPLPDAVMQASFARRARALKLRRCPQLRVSDAIASPQVSGLWRPVVLVPASHALTSSELMLALAHELAHLRRGDLWLGWVPALAQRLFFFHPLVAWAMREYALHREAACDAQVLQQTDTAPHAYGDLLLRLGVAQPIHSGLAGASPTFQNLKRRLIMLQQTDPLIWPRLHGGLLITLVALAGVLPWRVTAARADSANASTQATQAPPPPPAPQAPPPPPRDASGFSARHVDIETSTNARNGFALIDGDSVTVNGSEADLDTVKRLRKNHSAMLWFRRGDKAYVIHDPVYLQRAKAIYAPVTALARQQGELGGQQGQLGGKQGSLGARQGALGSKQAQLASQQAHLASELARIGQDGSDAALDAEQERLDSAMEALGRQQEALGEQQEALGRQQEALGGKQEALGERQQRATEQASRQIDTLLNEALAKGVAETAGSR